MRVLAAALLLTCLIASSGHADAVAETARAVKKPGALTLVKVKLAKKHKELAQKEKEKAPPAQQPPAATQTAKCEVIEFEASKTGTVSIDPKLAKHKKALGQPPLSAYDTFKVTGTQSLSMAAGKTGTAKITAKLELLFKGTVKKGKKERLQLEATIDDATGSRLYRGEYTQDDGATVIHSGGASGSAQLFLAVTCSAK